MVQLNLDIERAASEIAEKVTRDGKFEALYPPAPDDKLSQSELEAVRNLRDIPNIESTLKRLVAEGAAKVAFNFLNYLDGTDDPDTDSGDWSGVALIDHPQTGDPYENMLHDEFYDSYWHAKVLRQKRPNNE